jgi:zinc transporter, ZIP family
MGTGQTLLLGGIAGATIYLGLPMGRIGTMSHSVKAAFTAFATGILIFLLWDVLGHGIEPVESAVEGHDWGRVAELAPLAAGGLALGLMSLVYYDRWMAGKRATPLVGPGAAAVDEFTHRTWIERLTAGQRLALLIATGIGLHNFGEGLAIGQSAAGGEVSLALVLIIGFALHNATEGFGIVGPMSGEAERPSWGFLGLMGLIGGGPTFVGTVVGQAWVSEALEVAFFAIAAGSILYVVIQLFEVCRRYALPVVVAWWLLAGIAVGFATDFVLVAAGA